MGLTACGGGGSGTSSGGTSSSDGPSVPPPTGGGNGGSDTPPGTPPPGQSSSTVVYVADQAAFEKFELWAVDPGQGSAPVRVNGTLAADGDVDGFVFTPAANTVVYSADQNVVGRTELYLVNLASPGASVRINPALTANRDVLDFTVSPDGSKVVYRADQDADDVYELYLANTASPGSAVKLSGALTNGGWVRSGYTFSPDGTKVLYRADQSTFDRVELYMVDIAAPGNAQKMNGTLVAGGNVAAEFSFSPDNSTVAYVADQETDDKLELYTVPVSAPAGSHKMNGALVPAGDVCRYTWSPDSKRLAYCADQEIDEVLELYTVPLNAPGQSVKMNPPLASGGRVTSGYDFSWDSSFLVYAAKQDSATRVDLYRVNVAAPGIAYKLNAGLTTGGNVVAFRLRKDD
jgi:Tol biopolymer transport system component